MFGALTAREEENNLHVQRALHIRGVPTTDEKYSGPLNGGSLGWGGT